MKELSTDFQKIPASTFLCLAAAFMAEIDTLGIDSATPAMMLRTSNGDDQS